MTTKGAGTAGTIVAAVALALALFVAARPLGPAPALGPFLDPVHGVWALAAGAERPRRERVRLGALRAEARVSFDDRDVPHIFARSPEDAYRVLGWLHARDRLFQLDLQRRAGAGTLTELVGSAALEADRATRAIGMPWSAERKLAALDDASPAARAVAAYVDGINAYVAAMPARELPLEYRLLDARPGRWSAIDVLHLFNRMAWTLSYSTDDLERARAAALVGEAAADALYPRDAAIQEPVVPAGPNAPKVSLTPLPPPGAPDTAGSREVGRLGYMDTLLRSAGLRPRGHDGVDAPGSNAWAVSPERTARGRALLAADPHLDLTLPSLWYEAHLVVPGALDVYGATIVGAPWVIIGLNRDVAWSFTNGQIDAVDYYEETLDDAERPARYRLDGAWEPLVRRVERYLDREGRLLAADTLRLTHRGPLVREGDRALSMRWTLYEPSREADAFHAIAAARSAAEWLRAMEAMRVPVQAGVVADRAGAIAVRVTGDIPLRPDARGGARIRDGSMRAADWRGSLPLARLPRAERPAQGFLASANQQPVHPAADASYFGYNWLPPWRAMRINALLRADSAATPESMRRMQTDPGSARADYFVPLLLDAAARTALAGADDPLLREAAALLREWDRRYVPDDRHALLFERAMSELTMRAWDELEPPGTSSMSPAFPRPGEDALVRLLADSASAWWDMRHTPEVVERRDAVVATSLREALRKLRVERGEPGGDRWRWSSVRQANVRHLLRVRSLSALGLPIQGGPATLNPSANGSGFGSSWRMVIELGPEVRAWAIYPGGQTGNSASPRYRDRLSKWQRGELGVVRLPRAERDLGAERTSATLVLVPR